MKRRIRCPRCESKRLYKDGLRYLKDGTTVQRWLCRDCGYRFSDPSYKHDCNSLNKFQHVQKIQRLNLKADNSLTYRCQVCARRQGVAKNLVEVETRSEKRAAGATKSNLATIKGKILQYLLWLKNQGYSKYIKSRTTLLRGLIKRNADLDNPENVKATIANAGSWSETTKLLASTAYDSFLRWQGKTWIRPRYKQNSKLPFIPTEEELDILIAACGRKTATLLQILKETGMRLGEAWQFRWIDIDFERNTIAVNKPEKGSNPRILRMSSKLASMLESFTQEKL